MRRLGSVRIPASKPLKTLSQGGTASDLEREQSARRMLKKTDQRGRSERRAGAHSRYPLLFLM